MSEQDLNEVKETELVEDEKNILTANIEEELNPGVDQKQDNMQDPESTKTASPLEESPVINVDYLDKKILDMKTIDLDELKRFHTNHNKLATVTAVHPPVRFGELEIEDKRVIKFEEKSQSKAGWINGGFFVLNYKIFNYIEGDNTFFERGPLEKLIKEENFMAFKHEGFWKCMDNLRDKIILDEMCNNNKLLWKK